MGFTEALFATAILLLMPSRLMAAQLYSIYWQSDPQPCKGLVNVGMPGPVVSSKYSVCTLGGINLSICRSTVPSVDNDPWQAGAPITVIGASVTIWTSQPDVDESAAIGQAGGNGPDIFITSAAVGTHGTTTWLPAGDGISIPDTTTKRGANAHFDVYVGCDGSGQFQALVSVYYTSP